MIMPGDVIFHRHFVVLVVAVTPNAVDSVHLFWEGRHARRSHHNVMDWLTNGMGYALVRNGRPVIVVTNVV